MSWRALVRRHVPFGIRVRVRLARRWFRDRRDGVRFARKGDAGAGPGQEWGSYSLPLRIYPGQEDTADGKAHNLRMMARALDGTVVRPGETLSLWRLTGEPSARRGYRTGAALVDGLLTTGMGGSTCLLSTVVYNAGLLAGLTVVERHAHSVDTYGDERYFELGRDATIEYAYLDLRFRNDGHVPLVLRCEAPSTGVRAGFLGAGPRPFEVEIVVSEPVVTARGRLLVPQSEPQWPGYDGVRTRTWRTLRWPDGRTQTEDLGESVHGARPARVHGARDDAGSARR